MNLADKQLYALGRTAAGNLQRHGRTGLDSQSLRKRRATDRKQSRRLQPFAVHVYRGRFTSAWFNSLNHAGSNQLHAYVYEVTTRVPGLVFGAAGAAIRSQLRPEAIANPRTRRTGFRGRPRGKTSAVEIKSTSANAYRLSFDV